MFKDMGENNLHTAAELIIGDLSIMTGIKIPTGNALMRLTDLFAESLKQDYEFFSTSLMGIGLKKYCHVLTTGDQKSYGRTLSLADLHQVMNEFLAETQQADAEAKEVDAKAVSEKQFSEDEKQNIIRETIERTYQGGDFSYCTFADYNQLVRDKVLPEDAAKKNAWPVIKTLKEKYVRLAANVLADGKDGSVKGLVDQRNYQDKIHLLGEIENEAKAETVKMYKQWCKEQGRENIYIKQ